jgi:hypothetical protein
MGSWKLDYYQDDAISSTNSQCRSTNVECSGRGLRVDIPSRMNSTFFRNRLLAMTYHPNLEVPEDLCRFIRAPRFVSLVICVLFS